MYNDGNVQWHECISMDVSIERVQNKILPIYMYILINILKFNDNKLI